MIFSPKPFERYIAALRSSVQHSVLKNGTNNRHAETLKKINIAEALTYKDQLSAINITEFADSLLGTAQILFMQKGKKLKVTLCGSGVYSVNKRLLTALILELAYCDAANISVTSGEPRTVITAGSLSQIGAVPKLAKAMNADYLFEKKSGKIIIRIPTAETELKPVKTENEWYYLLDEFSPVNIWLK